MLLSLDRQNTLIERAIWRLFCRKIYVNWCLVKALETVREDIIVIAKQLRLQEFISWKENNANFKMERKDLSGSWEVVYQTILQNGLRVFLPKQDFNETRMPTAIFGSIDTCFIPRDLTLFNILQLLIF